MVLALGNYFPGPDDMVQCAWCYGKLQGWEQGDNPLKEHARHFASCPKFGDRQAISASSLINVHNTQGKLTLESELGERIVLNYIYINPTEKHPSLRQTHHNGINLISQILSLLAIRHPPFDEKDLRTCD